MSVGRGKEGRCGDAEMIQPLAMGTACRLQELVRTVDAPDNEQRRMRSLRQEFASSMAWSVMHRE